MNSKEVFYAVYNEKFGYLKNPRYDIRDYLTCQWGWLQREAYLKSDSHTLKSMILDLDKKYAENCTVKKIIKDKFVYYDKELYEFLIQDKSTLSLFSWNGALSERFEMIQGSIDDISATIAEGLPVERNKFGIFLEYLKQTKVIVQFQLESNPDDEIEALEEDLEILDKNIERYELAFEICGQKIEL